MRFLSPALIVVLAGVPALAGDLSEKDARKIVARFGKAVDKVNRGQLASPKAKDENELAKKLPAASRKGLAKLLDMPGSEHKWDALIGYGLAHELGHLIAMWGSRMRQEDHHAWAHYTGVVIVDACEKAPWARKLRDRRWRSVAVDRKKLEDVEPSSDSRDGVLRLLIELHDLVGTKRIGVALNHMDEKNMGHRINQVRYYSLADFEKALLAGTKSKKQKQKIKALLGD